MASKKGSVTRVLISIAFIALGLGFALDAVSNLLEMDFASVFAINSVLGVLMFVLGIMGISKASMKACRVIAVLVCILAIASFVLTVFSLDLKQILGGITTTFVWGLLAWIYFDIS